VGKKDVEDALEKLDGLTKEETSMTVARNLKVTHDIDENVVAIKETIDIMDGNRSHQCQRENNQGSH